MVTFFLVHCDTPLVSIYLFPIGVRPSVRSVRPSEKTKNRIIPVDSKKVLSISPTILGKNDYS